MFDPGQEKSWHPVHPELETDEKNAALKYLVYLFHPFAVVFGWLLIGLALLGPIGLIRRALPERD